MRYLYSFLVLIIMISSCRPIFENSTTNAIQIVQKHEIPTLDPDYWYQGKAEVNAYDLEQSRYGEIHKGDAILVFVTEDFLTDKQVKNDNYSSSKSIPVLKTNYMKKFTTGIYDYSIMSSIFTPVEVAKYPNTLKVTTTAQDWCGQSFMQLNHRKGKYQIQQNSYFESEGDQRISIASVVLEDELFNRIRLNPDAIPMGKMQVLPATNVIRLMHLKNEAENAILSKAQYLKKDVVGQNLQELTITYPHLDRKVEIIYEGNSPYRILKWKDSYPSFNGEIMTTTARLRKTILTDYWSKNSLKDQKMRTELGL